MHRARGSTRFAVLAALAPLTGCSAGPTESVAQNLAPDNGGQGTVSTSSTNNFDVGSTDGFFANLGTNGRTCGSCHVQTEAFTITPQHVQSLDRFDPIFAPVDGSDCPSTGGPDNHNSSELLNYALIRVQIGIPATANFSLLSASNPARCSIAPGSAGVNGQLFLFRRPLPSTNLIFDSAIMWDARESTPPSTEKLTTGAGITSTGPLLFDLADQANGATMGHAQGSSIAGTQAQADIVSFELALYTATNSTSQGLSLLANGANGGPAYLESTVAPAFFVGLNDPLKPGFTDTIFTTFASWEPSSPIYNNLDADQQAIGRGEAVFNTTTFTIHDVPGLNSVPGNPLYNPADPLAGRDIVGGCGVCHNSPNVGNHTTALAINIGITLAQPVNNDGSPNSVLDIGHLPVYTLKNSSTGATVSVTDPGRSLITGNWFDIGKTKGPILRGLDARRPFFHNGSAAQLQTVVEFYNQRFAIGLTGAEKQDLIAFLSAL